MHKKLAFHHRTRGVKVLKAVSSPLRLQILNLLYDKGPLAYTELMSSLRMSPSRDAGKFAYHLKFLLKADLTEADAESRKYCLTELGKMVIDVADRVEKKATKPKEILVRASKSALEDFDSSKITDSLIKEAKMPAEQAQKIAKEAEKRLLKSKTKYITAPLVREVVNGILIEKSLEEYRHKLTRLGLPTHEVSRLIEGKSTNLQKTATVNEAAGAAVLREFTLLNMFPRDVADAHLSGKLHINNLESWILKPTEIVHDLRFFYQHGLKIEKTGGSCHSYQPPSTLENALSTTFNILLHSTKETDEAQTLEYFNVFLAPFTKNTEPSRIKEALHTFILNINQHAEASLNLELTIPSFIADTPAVGPSGKTTGKYGDYTEETQQLASLILDVLAEENTTEPLFNPKIIIKTRPETSANERAKALLLKAHNLAAHKSPIYFAHPLEKDQNQSVYTSSGCKLSANLNKDWETDTLRTGCLGIVAVNLPKAAYECEKDKAKFMELLKERLEMANRALEIKYRTLRQHCRTLIPFLTQNANGDQYFRLENSLRLINLVGLKEAIDTFYGKNMHHDEKASKLIEEIAECISQFIRKTGKQHGKRLHPAMLPSIEASERLAQLDIDRYGLGKAAFSGTREKPFYSTINKLQLQNNQIPTESLILEQKLHNLQAGGSFTVIELQDTEPKPDELVALSKQITENSNVELFAYNRKLTYCSNCKKSWPGLLHKCPSCNITNTLSRYDPFDSL